MEENMASLSAQELVNKVLGKRNDFTKRGGELLLKKFFQNFDELLTNEFNNRTNACYADYIGCFITTLEHDSSCDNNLNIKLADTLEFNSLEDYERDCANGVLIELNELSAKDFKPFNMKSDAVLDIIKNLENSGYIIKWNVAKKMLIGFIRITE